MSISKAVKKVRGQIPCFACGAGVGQLCCYFINGKKYTLGSANHAQREYMYSCYKNTPWTQPIPKFDYSKLQVEPVEYKKYLASSQWKIKRLQRLSMPDGKECWTCGVNFVNIASKDIHVHHRSYANFGHERMEELVPACFYCNSVKLVQLARVFAPVVNNDMLHWLITDYLRRKERVNEPYGFKCKLDDEKFLELDSYMGFDEETEIDLTHLRI